MDAVVNDFRLEWYGSVFMLRPLTPVAHQWVKDHLIIDQWQSKINIAIEHRYAFDIQEGILRSGLTVKMS